MNICLIRCPSPFLIEDGVMPPMGLMAVATGLKLAGHEVVISDDIVLGDFDAYGFGPTTPEYSYALKTKDLIIEHNPHAKIVIGGPYATIQPRKCLDDGFDCVVVGDGEVLAETAFTVAYGIIKAQERPLDEYPMIDRDVLDIQKYNYTLDGQTATTIISSRGCPYHCGFCCKNHNKVRLRSADKVIDEIGHLYFKYGYGAILFPEDIFILNKQRAEAVFKYMKSLGIISRCLVRADVVVKHGQEFVDMMADGGCVEVGMGIESGSDTILKIANKGETVATIKKAIGMLKASGIRIKGFFIVGLPGESIETLNETRQFLDEMKLDTMDCKIFQPYPGSPIFDNRDDYDIDWKDIELENQFYKGRPGEYFGNVYTSHLTSEEIVREWVEMESTYKHA